jgi:hypothetical protein
MGFFDDVWDVLTYSPIGEYSGEIKDFFGISQPDTPDISAQEQEIMNYLQNYFVNASEEQKRLFPTILQSLGYTQGADGAITKLPYSQYHAGLYPYEQQGIGALEQYYGQLDKAIGGELPLSPGLEQNLADERRISEERLARRLGPNYFLSTPGIQTERALRTGQNITREDARQKLIDRYGRLAIGQAESVRTGRNQRAAMMAQLYQPEIAQGLYPLLESYEGYNLLPYQAEVAKQAGKRQLWSDIFGSASTAGAAYLGAEAA